MYKFRSMTDARDKNGELLPDEVRLTSSIGGPGCPGRQPEGGNYMRKPGEKSPAGASPLRMRWI